MPRDRNAAQAGPPLVLPLRDRLPNPPSDFVGRAFERERLKKSLTRGRAAVVWGIAGLGKTSLVLDTLHRHFAARVPRTLYVGLQPGREDVRVRVVRALAGASGAPEPDWQALLADGDNLVATAIDLADVGDLWVVLDDVQWAEPAHVTHLLTQVARFARRARWIAVGRVDPGVPELLEQTIALDAMPEADLARLAAAWAPRTAKAELRATVTSAAGSPWRLRRAIFGAAVPPSSDERAITELQREDAEADPLAGLPESAREMVQSLSLLEAPLPAEIVGTFSAMPPAEVLVSLERRGLLERTPRGMRLPDVARSLLTTRSESGDAVTQRGDAAALERGARIAEALTSQRDLSAVLEGLRLLASQRRADPCLATLEARGPQLLAAGYAPDLWRALSPLGDDPRLARWRLRCTVEFDSPAVLSAAVEQADPSPDDRLAWAQVLFRRGRIDGAERAATLALEAARASGDEALELDAAVLRARAIAQQGREAEALASLAGITPREAPARARLDALAAMLLTALDRRDEARERVMRLRNELPHLPTPAQLEVGFGVVQALYFLGQYREADEAIRDLVTRTGETALALSHGRRLLYYRASIAIERARLADARELLQRLQAFADGRSMFRAFVDFAAATLLLATGDTEELEALLPRVIAGGRALGEWNPHHVEAVLLAQRLAHLSGRAPVAPLPPDDALPRSEGYPARPRVALARLDAQLREGARPAPDTWPRPEAQPAWGDTRVLAWAVRARAALAWGDTEAAREASLGALRDATEGGSALAEADARVLLADVHAARGDTAELAREAQWLLAFGQSAPSARYVAEAQLCVAAGFAGRPDPAQLEKLASNAARSAPVVARRARALLGGGSTSLDAYDRGFVDAARRAWSRLTIERIGAAPAVDGANGAASTEAGATAGSWGLDVARMEVWLPGGEAPVSLRDRALLFRVLTVLAEHGGSAGKEALVQAVWDEREYHPLRHDNRLRLAVRKLRQAIERDAAHPLLVLTTEDGYALGGDPRWLRGG